MAQSTAHKPELPDKEEHRAHVLSLPPLERGQSDREPPHSYERWLIHKLMRMAGSPPPFVSGSGTAMS